MNGSEEKNPRRATGEYSAMSTVAPACSAPAPKPWHRRRKTSRIGAQMPIVSYVGRRPTSGRGPAHQQDRDDQHPLAAEPVADGAEEQPAERPGEEADAEGGEAATAPWRDRGWRRTASLKISADARPYSAKSKYSSALPALEASVARRRFAAYSGSSVSPRRWGGFGHGVISFDDARCRDCTGRRSNAITL